MQRDQRLKANKGLAFDSFAENITYHFKYDCLTLGKFSFVGFRLCKDLRKKWLEVKFLRKKMVRLFIDFIDIFIILVV